MKIFRTIIAFFQALLPLIPLYISMELIIFDRWGKRLRTLLSPDEGWDGTNEQGNHVQEGVYTFVLKFLIVPNNPQHKP